MQHTQVQSLGWKDPLKKEMAPTPVFLPAESHGQRRQAGYSQKSQARLSNYYGSQEIKYGREGNKGQNSSSFVFW